VFVAKSFRLCLRLRGVAPFVKLGNDDMDSETGSTRVDSKGHDTECYRVRITLTNWLNLLILILIELQGMRSYQQ
jgi:hypothetical protein